MLESDRQLVAMVHTHQMEKNLAQVSPAGVGLGTIHAGRIHHLHKETLVNVEILQQKGEESAGRQIGSQQKSGALLLSSTVQGNGCSARRLLEQTCCSWQGLLQDTAGK